MKYLKMRTVSDISSRNCLSLTEIIMDVLVPGWRSGLPAAAVSPEHDSRQRADSTPTSSLCCNSAVLHPSSLQHIEGCSLSLPRTDRLWRSVWMFSIKKEKKRSNKSCQSALGLQSFQMFFCSSACEFLWILVFLREAQQREDMSFTLLIIVSVLTQH